MDEVDGTQFTFELDQRVIKHSDGRILHLTLDQTQAMADVFNGILVADRITNDMDGAGMNCQAHPEACVEPTFVQPADPTSRFDEITPFSMTTGAITQGSTHDDGNGSAAIRSKLEQSAGLSVLMYASGDICSDIVNAALPRKLTYKERRTSLFKRMFESAKEVVAGQVIDQVLETPAWNLLVGGGHLNDNLDASIAVGMLAGYWNSYACGSRAVAAGPVFRWTGFEPGDFGVQKVCILEPAWVSFNNTDWYRIDVLFCEYKRVQ